MNIIMAINMGADDFIAKPFSLSILLAKVRAILKRYEKAAEAAEAVSAKAASAHTEQTQLPITPGLVLDRSLHQILRGNPADSAQQPVSLKAMEYKLLCYLLEHRGRVITKDEFLQNVWGDLFIGEGTLSVHIRHLREKIEADPAAPQLIKTVWGVGYLMEEPGKS